MGRSNRKKELIINRFQVVVPPVCPPDAVTCGMLRKQVFYFGGEELGHKPNP